VIGGGRRMMDEGRRKKEEGRRIRCIVLLFVDRKSRRKLRWIRDR
jgi:hypothetical protein